MWTQIVNGILGLWVILVPFLGMSTNSMRWVLVITGAVIAILAFAGRSVTAGDYGAGRPV